MEKVDGIVLKQENFRYDDFHPGFSIDTVIFGFHDCKLMVLLNKYHSIDEWAVPRGFVYKNESIEDAVARLLKEKYEMEDVYTNQFRTFGAIDQVSAESQRKT